MIYAIFPCAGGFQGENYLLCAVRCSVCRRSRISRVIGPGSHWISVISPGGSHGIFQSPDWFLWLAQCPKRFWEWSSGLKSLCDWSNMVKAFMWLAHCHEAYLRFLRLMTWRVFHLCDWLSVRLDLWDPVSCWAHMAFCYWSTALMGLCDWLCATFHFYSRTWEKDLSFIRFITLW